MRNLYYALLGFMAGPARVMAGPARVKHYIGMPPELTGGEDHRVLMPAARVLVLMEDANGSIYLYRFAADGTFAGDTWHPDLLQAQEQAEFEYDEALGPWQPVPAGVTDLDAFITSVSE